MKIVAEHHEDNAYRKQLVRELVSFNNANGPSENWEYVGFYAPSDGEELIGGVQGNFEWDWLHIKHLWVKQSGIGLGGQLMKRAEDYAKERGKTGILLDTFSFQAKPFYEKMGFSVLGTIEQAAADQTRYFMTKRLR